MRNKKKKLLGGLSLGLAAALAIGSSLAYFTDREVVTAKGTAGGVGIHVDNHIDLSTDQTDPRNILNPGDKKDISYTVYEDENKSVDIRETLDVWTLGQAMTTDKNGQAEFDIYNVDDVEEKTDTDGNSLGWGPKKKADGTFAQPLQTRKMSDDGKKIYYYPEVYSLNGNSADGEAEQDIDGATNSKERHFALIFRRDSSNKFQGQTVAMHVLVEAKQHRNTQGDGKWEEIANETYTLVNFNNGETLYSADAVPERSLDYTFKGFNTIMDGKSIHLMNDGSSFRLTLVPKDGVATLKARIPAGRYSGSYYDDKTGVLFGIEVNIEKGKTEYDLSDQMKLNQITLTGVSNLKYYSGYDFPKSLTLNSSNKSSKLFWEYSEMANYWYQMTQKQFDITIPNVISVKSGADTLTGYTAATSGKFTGTVSFADDSGREFTVPITLNLQEGVTTYDLSDQLNRYPSQIDGKDTAWRTLTVTIPSNPDGKARVDLTNNYGHDDTYGWDVHSSVYQSMGDASDTAVTKTFRIAKNADGTYGDVEVSIQYDDDTYTYNGDDSDQTVNMSNGDATVTFNGTWTKNS